jgi:hypothetical protein
VTLEVVSAIAHAYETCTERAKTMVPNIHIHEQLMVERTQQWQREIERQQLLAPLRKPHASYTRHLIGSLGTLFVALGTRMKQLEQRSEPSV